jgi:hypothetical protein
VAAIAVELTEVVVMDPVETVHAVDVEVVAVGVVALVEIDAAEITELVLTAAFEVFEIVGVVLFGDNVVDIDVCVAGALVVVPDEVDSDMLLVFYDGMEVCDLEAVDGSVRVHGVAWCSVILYYPVSFADWRVVPEGSFSPLHSLQVFE